MFLKFLFSCKESSLFSFLPVTFTTVKNMKDVYHSTIVKIAYYTFYILISIFHKILLIDNRLILFIIHVFFIDALIFIDKMLPLFTANNDDPYHR